MSELLAKYALYSETFWDPENDFKESIRDNGIGSTSGLGMVSLYLLAEVYNLSLRIFEVQIHRLTFA